MCNTIYIESEERYEALNCKMPLYINGIGWKLFIEDEEKVLTSFNYAKRYKVNSDGFCSWNVSEIPRGHCEGAYDGFCGFISIEDASRAYESYYHISNLKIVKIMYYNALQVRNEYGMSLRDKKGVEVILFKGWELSRTSKRKGLRLS